MPRRTKSPNLWRGAYMQALRGMCRHMLSTGQWYSARDFTEAPEGSPIKANSLGVACERLANILERAEVLGFEVETDFVKKGRHGPKSFCLRVIHEQDHPVVRQEG